MGHTWGRQDPGGPHVGPMILAIWDLLAMEGCLFIKVLSNFEIKIPNNNSEDMAIPNRLSSAKYQNESTA